MEKIEQYRAYIQQVITDYAGKWSSKSEIDRQLIFDTVRDHYQSVQHLDLTFLTKSFNPNIRGQGTDHKQWFPITMKAVASKAGFIQRN